MWSARSGFTPAGQPGVEPPRTNDIDVDERRKTIAAAEGERSTAVERGLTNTEAPHPGSSRNSPWGRRCAVVWWVLLAGHADLRPSWWPGRER